MRSANSTASNAAQQDKSVQGFGVLHAPTYNAVLVCTESSTDMLAKLFHRESCHENYGLNQYVYAHYPMEVWCIVRVPCALHVTQND